jgi:hypothetical protein
MFPETCVPLIAMVVLDALVICPCALTAMVALVEAEPYVAAETPVVAILNV